MPRKQGVPLETFAEQMLLEQIQGGSSKTPAFDKKKAEDAVARIRELTKGVRPDLQGMSLRDFAHVGHRF